MATRENEGLSTAARNVADHARSLVALEVELAKLEIKRKIASLGIGIGLLVAAAVLSVFALGFLLATVAAALALVGPTWAAILVVGGVLLLVAGTLAVVGISAVRKGAPPVPEQAIEEARRTTETLKSNGSR
jgi:hypothetical protein